MKRFALLLMLAVSVACNKDDASQSTVNPNNPSIDLSSSYLSYEFTFNGNTYTGCEDTEQGGPCDSYGNVGIDFIQFYHLDEYRHHIGYTGEDGYIMKIIAFDILPDTVGEYPLGVRYEFGRSEIGINTSLEADSVYRSKDNNGFFKIESISDNKFLQRFSGYKMKYITGKFESTLVNPTGIEKDIKGSFRFGIY